MTGTTVTWPTILLSFDGGSWKLERAPMTLTQARLLRMLIDDAILTYEEHYGERDLAPPREKVVL